MAWRTLPPLLSAGAILAAAASPARAQAWSLQEVDSDGLVGAFTSLELDAAGNPHVSYYDQTNRSLKYAWFDGAAWNLETVHSVAGVTVGAHCSLAFDGIGTPHIAYMDATNADLWHAWKVGGAWQREVVASAGLVGAWCSIAYNWIGDTLHISYYDFDPNDRDLMHAFMTSAGGAWSIETVDVVGDVGSYSSIAVDPAGDIHVSYYDKTNTDLKHAEKTGGGWLLSTVDLVGADADLLGKYSSIAIAPDGEPHISYFDETPANRDLKHAWRAAGAWSTEDVDAGGVVGLFTALVFDGAGIAHISYLDGTNGDLDHAWLDPAAGAWATETVDGTVGKRVGLWTSIQVDAAGLPRISYHSLTDRSLRYAKKS